MLRLIHTALPALKRGAPRGGKRLLQKADGYAATVKSGQVTFRNGEMVGPTPGGVIRGAQAVASSS